MDFPRRNILDEFGRGGYIRQTSSVRGYVDESVRQTGPLAVEVASEVDSSCELPDNFGQTEVKWGKVKDRYLSRSYRLRAMWERQFLKARIYIIDPYCLIGVAENISEIEIARRILLLDPAGWTRVYPIQQDGIHYSMQNPEAMSKFLEDELLASTSKKGNSITNVKRRVVRSQALHADLPNLLPIVIKNGRASLVSGFMEPEARDIALPLTANVTYDEGHSSDLVRLQNRLEGTRDSLSVLSHRYEIPEFRNQSVIEKSSRNNELIQLADFCAGYASDIYTGERERDRLPQMFRAVYVNGQKM